MRFIRLALLLFISGCDSSSEAPRSASRTIAEPMDLFQQALSRVRVVSVGGSTRETGFADIVIDDRSRFSEPVGAEPSAGLLVAVMRADGGIDTDVYATGESADETARFVAAIDAVGDLDVVVIAARGAAGSRSSSSLAARW